MYNRKKALSIFLLCAILILILNPIFVNGETATSSTFKDIKKHWALTTILKFVNAGLISGYSDKTFKPDKAVSKAEFTAMINPAFNFITPSTQKYNDLSSKKWYYNSVLSALNIGYISKFSDNTVRAEKPMSRYEVALSIARILRLEPESESLISNYKDLKSLSIEEKQIISAVVKKGYMFGYPDETFRPQKSVTRAEAITVINKATGTIYLKSGVYGGTNSLMPINGNLTISGSGIKLKNTVVAGDLYITEGVGEGDVSFDNVIITGRSVVCGGGTNSVSLSNSILDKIIVNKKNGNVRLLSNGSTKTGEVWAYSSCKLQETNQENSGFNFVKIKSSNSQVALDGDFSRVEMSASSSKLEISGGNVQQIQALYNSVNSTVTVKNGNVEKVDISTKINFEMNDGSVGVLNVQEGSSNSSINILKGNLTQFDINVPTKVSISGGLIENLNVNRTANDSSIKISGSSVVSNIKIDSPISISGNGNVQKAEVTVKGVSFETKPKYLFMGAGITVDVAGVIIDKPSQPTPIPTATPIPNNGGATPSPQATSNPNQTPSATTRPTQTVTSSPSPTPNPLTLPFVDSGKYDCATGILTLSGSNFTSFSGAGNDINPLAITISCGINNYKLTASTKGVDILDANSANINIGDLDRAYLNGIFRGNGTSYGGQQYLMSFSNAWNGQNSLPDATGNLLEVKNVSLPQILDATYDIANGRLDVYGENLRAYAGSYNDVISSKITFMAGSVGRVLYYTTSVDVESYNHFIIPLSSTDKPIIDMYADANGVFNSASQIYNLSADNAWNGTDSTADNSNNVIQVKNQIDPYITSATYNFNTGILTLTGGGFKSINGTTNDVDVTKLSILSGTVAYTLTQATSNIDISSSSTANIYIGGIDRAILNTILNTNGSSGSSGVYAVSAAAYWNGTGAGADLVGNSLTVSNFSLPYINSATYNNTNGQLVISGFGFRSLTGAANDIDPTKFTIQAGSVNFTLTSITSQIEVSDSSQFIITLAGTDKTSFEAVTDTTGTLNSVSNTYNISVAAGWNGSGSTADTTGNTLNVSNMPSPYIISANYNSSTGVLSLVGDAIRPLPGVIDIDPTKITVYSGSSSYTLTTATQGVEIIDSTSANITIAGIDRACINSLLTLNGTVGSGGANSLTLATGWNGNGSFLDSSNNVITVTNYAAPTITSAILNVGNGVLTISGTGFKSFSGSYNDIDPTCFTFNAIGGSSRTISAATSAVDVINSTSFSITLANADLMAIELFANSNGTQNIDLQTYNITAAQNWNGTGTSLDNGVHAVTVSGQVEPTITSATFDFATKILSIAGTGFRTITGASNDINSTKITISDGIKSYTLSSDTVSVEILTSSSASIMIGAIDAAMLNAILSENGTGTSPNSFSLSVASTWNGTGSSIDSNNPITVSNYSLPVVSSVDYNSSTGQLTLTGSDFAAVNGNNNDIDVTTITIVEGGVSYALTTATSNVDVANSSSAVITFGGMDRARINKILNNNGTQSIGSNPYQILLGDNWNLGAPSTPNISNPGLAITVSNYSKPLISSAAYNFSTGVLTLTGTGFASSTTVTDDIIATCFTIGDGLTTRVISINTANVDVTGSTSAILTLSDIDRAYVNYILNKNGTAADNARAYNLQASDDWNTAAPTTLDLSISTIPITVSNYLNPIVTSATYNRTDGALTVTGANMRRTVNAADDINTLKIRIRGLSNTTYTLTAATSNVDITDCKTFTITVAGVDKNAIELLLDKDGGTATDGTSFNIEMIDDWNFNIPSADISDISQNQIIVSGINDPILANIGFDNRGATKKIIVSNNTLPQYTLLEIVVKAGLAPISTDGPEFSIDLSSGTNRTIGSHNLVAAQGSTVAEGDTVYYRYVNGNLKSNWISDSIIPITPINSATAVDGNFLVQGHLGKVFIENSLDGVLNYYLSTSKDNGTSWTDQISAIVAGDNTLTISGGFSANDQFKCSYFNQSGNYSLGSNSLAITAAASNGSSNDGEFIVLGHTNSVLIKNTGTLDNRKAFIQKNAQAPDTGTFGVGSNLTIPVTGNLATGNTIKIAVEDEIGNSGVYGTAFTVQTAVTNNNTGDGNFVVNGYLNDVKVKNSGGTKNGMQVIVIKNSLVNNTLAFTDGVDKSVPVIGGITNNDQISISIMDAIGNTTIKSATYTVAPAGTNVFAADGDFTVNASLGTVTIKNTGGLNNRAIYIFRNGTLTASSFGASGDKTVVVSSSFSSSDVIKVSVEIDTKGNSNALATYIVP